MKHNPCQRRRLFRYALFLNCLLLSITAFAGNKVVIGFDQAPLKEVFSKIESAYAVTFTYDNSVLQGGRRISLPARERTLTELLDQLEPLAGLKFMQVGKMIGVQQAKRSAAVLTAEEVTVKGRVTDAGNKPLTDVSINIKGSSKGVITNANGEFTIRVEKGETIRVSSVGYEPREYLVNDNITLTIVLQPEEKRLEEVVVTALGIKKEKAKVAYAMQEVKGEALQKAPESNIANNMVGKVAGLSIQTKSTLFENPDIRLRGEGVLVVIDGVPSQTDFWNINPNDIESVNVLKGTAAATLYGSLGINGAIMITTKKGKAGANGIEVVYNTTTQFQAGFLRIPKAQKEYGMGWNGYYAFINGKGGGGWYDDYGYVWGPKLNQPDPNTASGFMEVPQYNSPYDPNQLFTFTQNGSTGQSHYKPIPWVSKGGDNLKNFLNNELTTTHNISVAGKTDLSEYRISVAHTYQRGQIPNTHLNSTSLSLAGNLKVTKQFKIESSISYNRQYTPNYPETGYGPNNFLYNIAIWMGPDVDVRDLRNYWQPAGGRTTGSGGFIPYGVKDIQQFNYNYSWYNNPYFLAYEYQRGYTNDVVVGQINGTYDFTKNLQLLVRTGATVNNSTSDTKIPYSYINYGTSAAPKGNYSINDRNNLLIVSDVLLTYKQNFLKNFSLALSGGGSNRYSQYKRLTATTVGGLNVPTFYSLSNSITQPASSENERIERQVRSLFGYADIGYKEMVYVNFTGRNDWTSTLQKPYNSFFYPSVSLSIIGSQIVQLPDVISYFKLRGAYAKISADVDPYYTLATYSIGTPWNGGSSLNLPGTLIPSNIRPKTTISQEYGTELRFLKNRIGIDLTYYRYLEKNFPKDVPLSQASGFNYVRTNADEVVRKGLELVVTGSPIRTTDVRWDITANYSSFRRIAQSFYGNEPIRDGVKPGERMGVYRGWAWERSPGGQIVYGSNGYPQYIDHVINLGYNDPSWEFGVLNSVSYKNYSLSFSFDGRIGGVIYNGVEQRLYEGGMHPGTANKDRDDSYAGNATYVGQGVVVTSGEVEYDAQGKVIKDTRQFAPNTKAVKYIDWIFATYVNGIDEANIYKRSFVKLREVVLTWNAPPTLIRKTPFKGASLSVTGRNLAIWSKVPYMDPDGYAGLTLAEPSYRNIGINLNLKF